MIPPAILNILSNILFSRSTDGGMSFSLPVNLSNSPGCSFNPIMVVDASDYIKYSLAGSI